MPARVELHLPVDRVLDLGEVDDLVEPAGTCLRLSPSSVP